MLGVSHCDGWILMAVKCVSLWFYSSLPITKSVIIFFHELTYWLFEYSFVLRLIKSLPIFVCFIIEL